MSKVALVGRAAPRSAVETWHGALLLAASWCLDSALHAHCCRLRGALDSYGVDTQLVREVEGPSGTAVILLEEDGALSLLM